MKLTNEQLEVIQQASGEIDFGRVIISFTGQPHNIVDIVAEKHLRFRREKDAEPTKSKPQDLRGSGRYGSNGK